MKARKKTVAKQFAKNIAEELVDETAAPSSAHHRLAAAEPAAEEAEESAASAAPRAHEHHAEHPAAETAAEEEEEGGVMRGFSFFLALVSFAMALGLGYMVYDMNGKITRLEAQNANQTSLARDIAGLRGTLDKVDKLDESVRGLRTGIAKISADNLQTLANIKDNAVAIDEMKRRFNRLIDAVK